MDFRPGLPMWCIPMPDRAGGLVESYGFSWVAVPGGGVGDLLPSTFYLLSCCCQLDLWNGIISRGFERLTSVLRVVVARPGQPAPSLPRFLMMFKPRRARGSLCYTPLNLEFCPVFSV